MEKKKYTLRELSEDLDVSIRDLKNYIRKGVLKARKVGRAYVVTIADIDTFMDNRFPTRNYLCPSYDKCLDSAARANTEFNCANCRKNVDTGVSADAFLVMETGLRQPFTIH